METIRAVFNHGVRISRHVTALSIDRLCDCVSEDSVGELGAPMSDPAARHTTPAVQAASLCRIIMRPDGRTDVSAPSGAHNRIPARIVRIKLRQQPDVVRLHRQQLSS